MVLSPEQMKCLKKVELDILKKFIEACEELHLNYFIVQGSLIGAVRHKGFIPWDDDIDVGMMREDYEVFLKKGQELLPEGYFLQTHDTDPGYIQSFAKVRKTESSFVETTVKNRDMNHGIYIDVFPFDYYPENKMGQRIFEIKKLLLKFRIRNEFYVPADNAKGMKNRVKKVLMKFSMLLYPTLEGALDEQQKLFKGVKDSSYLVNNGSPWGQKEIVMKKWMTKTQLMEFEGIEVRVPEDYDSYLTKVYGNYMQFPPVEKQVPHHYISYISFDKAYKVHQK